VGQNYGNFHQALSFFTFLEERHKTSDERKAQIEEIECQMGYFQFRMAEVPFVFFRSLIKLMAPSVLCDIDVNSDRARMGATRRGTRKRNDFEVEAS
jgi:hypothetical protein